MFREILPGGRFLFLLLGGLILAVLYFGFGGQSFNLFEAFILIVFIGICVFLIKAQYKKPMLMPFEKLQFTADIRSIPILESKKIVVLSLTHLKGNFSSGKFSIDLDDVKQIKKLPQSRRDEVLNNSGLLIVHLENTIIDGNKMQVEKLHDLLIQQLNNKDK